jgi:SAM-dependent methyltransferase
MSAIRAGCKGGFALQPYEALATVYDRWNGRADYRRWAEFLHARFAEAGSVRRILDVCCGTGRMIGLLQEYGYEVDGVDGSAQMLERAAGNVAPGTRLRHAVLPGASAQEPVDAAVCSFDSVNYFVTDEDLRGLFRFVAASLRPGGLFAFDVHSPYKLREFYGNNHFGDDHGDFAFVWRNRINEDAHTIRYLITIFTATEAGYQRYEEVHEQRWYEIAELTEAAKSAGFSTLAVTDNYSMTAAHERTLRQTWLLRRESS